MKKFRAASHPSALMFACATFQQLFTQTIRYKLGIWWDKLVLFLFPYVQITFHECKSGLFNRNEAYSAIESYLHSKSITQCSRLKGECVKKGQPLVLTMDDYEEVEDEFHGVKVKWCRGKSIAQTMAISNEPDRMYYQLTFLKKDKKFVTDKYLKHVMEDGRARKEKRQFRRIYTKSPSDVSWDYAVFQHPCTFSTYAMDPNKKEVIIDDLLTFIQAKDYYAKIGKVWKRGYLLSGPPGTGKSTMIAAMSNLLDYDIYDLELATIKSNAELKTLMMNTTGKSIIVVEDVDCTLDLIGKQEQCGADETAAKITLSSFLSFVDGIWSGCGDSERILVFTATQVDQLDPGLIRSGRMDRHIELSYCCFKSFKVLARNYWNINSHPLFEKIEQLLRRVDMTPADVAENLIPKTIGGDVHTSLTTLIQALENAQEKAKKNAKKETEVIVTQDEEDEEEEKEKVKAEDADEEEVKNRVIAEDEEDKEKVKTEDEAKILEDKEAKKKKGRRERYFPQSLHFS